MSHLSKNGVDLHYEFEQQPGLPVLVFSNSLGTDRTMWDQQMDHLRPYLSILRYDAQGQGSSSTPRQTITIADMGQDVLSLLDALDIQTAHFCGLSMGGMVGQWLGIHAPARLRSLVLSNTAAHIGNQSGWNERIEQVRQHGISSIVPSVLERWYTHPFRKSGSPVVEKTRALLLRNEPAGYIAGCQAVRDANLQHELSRITAPTLVFAGSLDPVTTVQDAEYLTSRIGGSQLEILEAAHLSNTEVPAAFNRALLHFCQSVEEGFTHDR